VFLRKRATTTTDGSRAGSPRFEEGPRRGTKPTEGQGATRLATVERRYGPDSGGKPRSRVSRRRSIETRNRQRNWKEMPRRNGGNGKGATATAMWNGCNRVEFFEGCEQRRGKCPGTPDPTVSTGGNGRSGAGNTANLMTGSGMQQARDLRAEETIGVVQNHEDGTRFAERDLREPKRAAMHAGVDARQGRYRGMQTKGEGRKVRETGPETTGNTLWRRAKTRGSARFEASQGAPERRDAVGRPRRRARQRVTSRRERESPTTRYDGSTSHERDFTVPPRATP